MEDCEGENASFLECKNDRRKSSKEPPFFSWALLWKYTGPGWLMSMAYLDPGNLEADLQNGAYTGYQLIWVLFMSTIVGFILQVLAARLGTVTGRHLAEICKSEYSRTVSIILWLMTEIAIIGSDIQEVIGSAIAFRILFGCPLWVGCLITGLDTFTFLGLHSIGMRYLEAFFCVIIATMSICFFVDFGLGDPEPLKILGGFVPTMKEYAVIQAVGTVGAIIMPHNIFLHSALVQSRSIDRNDSEKVKEANKYFSIEAGVALFISFLINLAVVAVFAKSFFFEPCSMIPQAQTACIPYRTAISSGNDIYNYKSGGLCTLNFNQTVPLSCPECQIDGKKAGFCQQVGLSDAGDAISDILGESARTVWAIGLLAAGQASTMTGTYAGQFVMQGFLDIKLVAWKRVIVTRGLALIPAVFVAILSESNASKSDVFDEWLNVLQSIQLPFALIPLLRFTKSKELMGGNFRNSTKVNGLMYIIATLVCLINFILMGQFLWKIFADLKKVYLLVAVPITLFVMSMYFGFMYCLFTNTSKSTERHRNKEIGWMLNENLDLNEKLLSQT